MQSGVQSYESFLSALAGVTGTLIALLLGFVGAYYVFLRERTSQFDDHIAQQKIEIRDTAGRLRSAWRMSPALYAYLPPDFESYVRAKYPNASEADVLGLLSADLMFENPSLRQIVSEHLTEKPYDGPWRGRVYYWLLGKTVELLTLNPPSLESFPPKVPETAPKGVFPNEPFGPGFEAWYATHGTIRRWVSFFLRRHQQGYEDDYFAFTAGRTGGMKPKVLNEIFKTSTAAFYEGLDELNKEVDSIDRDRLLAGRYRPHLPNLLVLLAFSAAIGMLAPLLLMVLPGFRPTTILVLALLFGTVLFLGAAYVQLAWDVAMEPKENRSEYLRNR